MEVKTNPPTWRTIFQGFSLNFRKPLLVGMWLVITILGAEICVYVYSKLALNIETIHATNNLGPQSSFWDHFSSYLVTVFQFSKHEAIHIWQWAKLQQFCQSLDPALTPWAFYCIAVMIGSWCYLWTCYYMSALYRIAAVKLTAQRDITIRDALKYSREHFWTFFWTPLTVVLGAAILLLANFFIAKLGHVCEANLGNLLGVSVGTWFAVLVWPLLLLTNLGIVILVVGFVFASPFMFAAIAVDGCSHYDAISRSLIYFYRKIWHYLCYQLLALIQGLSCAVIILVVGCLLWMGSCWALHLGMTNIPPITGIVSYLRNLEQIAAGDLPFLILSVAYAIALLSFVLAHYIFLQTSVYTLLRYQVDGAKIEQSAVKTD